jgi:hypothetical protein
MAYYFGDALSDIRKIKGKPDGHLDMSSLPSYARKIIERKDKKTGKTIVEEGRDLGAMISILTKAVQELDARLDKLEAINGKGI